MPDVKRKSCQAPPLLPKENPGGGGSSTPQNPGGGGSTQNPGGGSNVQPGTVPGASNINGEWIAGGQKRASFKKVSSQKKGFKLTWKKVSSVKGYQIQYASNKKFTSNVTTKLIGSRNKTKLAVKNLQRKKKYYVRIRTYKTSKLNGKTVKVYSKWSKVKTVKTK